MAETMGRCKDCKWWTGAGIGAGSRYCPLATSGRGLIYAQSQLASRAIAWTRGNDRAHLATYGDFGCVQFESKEATDA